MKTVIASLPVHIVLIQIGTASGAGSIQLSACPNSACPGNYQSFPLEECTLMYQCFQAANGEFGYIYPRIVDREKKVVAVDLYDTGDDDCSGPQRTEDPLSAGWMGECSDECWGEHTSKIGVGPMGCNLDGTDGASLPSTNGDSGSGSIQLSASCTDSACPGKHQTFPIGVCSLMYQCFQEANGKFGYIYPRIVDREKEVVAVDIYDVNDIDCSGAKRFEDPLSVGWMGTCSDECWGELTSQIGVGPMGCDFSGNDGTSNVPSSSSLSSDARKAYHTAGRAAVLAPVIGMISFFAQL